MSANVWPVDAVTGAPSYTGRMLRQLAGLLWARNPSRPLGARSGVVAGTPTSIASATSSTWTVTPFGGVIDGESAAVAGAYNFSFDSNQTGPVTAADATNPRIDLLYVRVSDPAEGDGSTNPVIELLYLAGTPAASPSAPSTPSRSMPVATILVPKSGSGSPVVSWAGNFAVAAGGIGPVPAGSYPSSPYKGQYVDDATLGLLRWNGSAWVQPLSDTGWLTTTSLGSGWAQDSTPMQARQIGNVIYLTGGVVNASFNDTTYTAACALPSGVALPPTTQVLNVFPGGGTFGTGRAGRILTDGTVQFATSASTSIAYRVDGFSYLST